MTKSIFLLKSSNGFLGREWTLTVMLSVPVGDRESGKKLSLQSWYVEGYEDRRGGPDDSRPGPCLQDALASAKLTDSA